MTPPLAHLLAPRPAALPCALLTLLALAAAPRPATAPATRPAADPLTIERADPRVGYRTFDPRNPPADMPELRQGEEAVCVWRVDLHAHTSYSVRTPPRPRPAAAPRPAAPAPRWEADVTVTALTLRWSLDITIWLPEGATPALKAHEEGHRAIAEAFYATAEARARRAAAPLVGHAFKVPGDNPAPAADREIDRLNKTLTNTLLDALDTPCSKAQDFYDALTDHGRKPRPTPAEAIQLTLTKHPPTPNN